MVAGARTRSSAHGPAACGFGTTALRHLACTAGIGIANMIVAAMVGEGATEEDARKKISLFDVHGLLTQDRNDLSPSQKVYARDGKPTQDLAQAAEVAKPTVLIGVSTVGGLFTEKVIKAVAANTDRPIIFPLSNPTTKAEATPEHIYTWTDGKALVACGVQFPDVEVAGKTFHPGQANNFYIFPAIGLAIYVTKPKRIDDAMFIQAARGSADQVGQADRAKGMLFPKQTDILQTELTTATRVAESIFDRGLATVERPRDIRAWLQDMAYTPRYGETKR